MKTRYIIALLIALCCSLQLSAQNIFTRFYKNVLTKPRNVDSSYVYQHHLGFSPSFTSNFSSQSVSMTNVLKKTDIQYDENDNPLLDEYGDVTYFDYSFNWVDKMQESLSKRVGLFLGIGRMGLGWGIEVAPDSTQSSQNFQFSFRGNKMGLNIYYLSFEQQVEERQFFLPESIALGEGRDTFPGNHLSRLTVEGYYVLNPRRFAYPPGIAGNMVQLKSAGSWMLAARFHKSNFAVNPDEGFASFGTTQLALGCGYSYTWVPFSRPPRSDGKGMYTVFINGTLIPMLTLYNYLSIDIYDNVPGITTPKEGSFCWPTPNLLANATIGVSWSRFYLGAQLNYNVFHFNTRNSINSNPFELDDDEFSPYGGSTLNVMGVFYEWNVGLKFQVCF